MEISGNVKMIGVTQDVNPTFRKRELVVTTEEQYPQHILIEFHQDKCDLLNNLQIGSQITVSINLRGRSWTNPQGEEKYFNSIQGWRISTQQQQQQPQQGYTNTGYHGNGSATQAYFNQQNQQQNYPQQQAGFAPPPAPQNGGQQQVDDDGLPF